MPKPTYSRSGVALVLICAVCFLLPFALRGAKLSLQDLKNNVADWLPDHYVETQELEKFAQYFDSGARFVVLSGPWCKEGNPTFEKLRGKIRQESLEYEEVLRKTDPEELQAHLLGDELGLMFADEYHDDWGEQREKWLLGRDGQWYFITHEGRLYRWEHQNNVVEGIQLAFERSIHGKNKVDRSFFIKSFGAPPGDKDNEYYANPSKLFARPFKSVISGPEVLEQMAGAEGTLRIGKGEDQERSAFEAKIEAHKRLTGSLFGPTPAATFAWTYNSLLQHVDEAKRDQLEGKRIADPELREAHQQRVRQAFERFVNFELAENYDDDLNKLCNARRDEQLELWYRLWYDMGIDPPARQTCLIVTLNEPIKDELARAIGRPILGKPRGRLLELATGICGISPENVRIGGPPSDNVAIDEEGTNTLLRLAGLSLLIGLTLAYLSFSSIRVAFMLFFVGGVAAIASLSYVWFGGYTMDAILMSMPSLIYVLGLSSAVHIVNYYRDACYEDGPELAVETAVAHSWFPCTLAAFTTALGLISLTTSNLTPIFKFGLFSAIAVMMTVFLLFSYLPAALVLWSPGYKKRDKSELAKSSGISVAVQRFWSRVGDWVIKRHALVAISSVLLLAFFAVGVTRVETSVHLLKLFDSDAKILRDYRWMEDNLGQLVPAEIAPQIALSAQQEVFHQQFLDKIYEREKSKYPDDMPRDEVLAQMETLPFDDDYRMKSALRYSMLERLELSRRIRRKLERYFGPDGMGIVGSGMSMDVFTPLYKMEDQVDSRQRVLFSNQLWRKRDDMLEQDYYAVNSATQEEIWRVSIRLAALNNVDYGQFVNDLKAVVEPIMTAYQQRTKLLETLQDRLGSESLEKSQILVLGRDPDAKEDTVREKVAEGASISELIDQTYIFSDTLQDLLENRGIVRGRKKGQKNYTWIDPDKATKFPADDVFIKFLDTFDCVVVIEDDPLFDMDLIRKHTATQPGDANAKPMLMDFRDHEFVVDPETKQPVEGMLTAKARQDAGEAIDISTMYTGIVPIVYKAQRSLLESLIQSIGLAFVMISVVMMLLLRPWGSPVRPTNLLNIRGGMISMLPNMFPVIVVFGFMGHMNRWFSGQVDAFLVDIGSMMTASVAMGVAVDDTIHFLNWYRNALAKGHDRKSAIKVAYDRVATAMTQTTLIGGLGLSAFALSTFTPTQRFGVLMLILLGMALVGDLILLPALIAGPLGKYFGKEQPQAQPASSEAGRDLEESEDDEPQLRVVDQDETNDQAIPPNPYSNNLPEVILPEDAEPPESRRKQS
jgi:predicted RND superfamily exporter protein